MLNKIEDFISIYCNKSKFISRKSYNFNFESLWSQLIITNERLTLCYLMLFEIV